MNIHEYQGKELLKSYGVAVLDGRIAWSPEEAEAAARTLPGPVYVVKSQIHAGGRGAGRFADDPDGKGGVRLARSPEEVRAAAEAMLGHVLVTKQTGAAGRKVHRVYVEAGLRHRARAVPVAADRPGERARHHRGLGPKAAWRSRRWRSIHPERILRAGDRPGRRHLRRTMARRLAYGLGLSGKQIGVFGRFIEAMYKAFLALDCEIVEINPLVVTGAGEIVALDAKVSFDDNALFRHPELEKLRDEAEEDPKELEAARHSLNYVALDGSIGCMVNGAGLAMATMDIIKLYGSAPANFLDVGGGATKERVTAAFKIILSDPHVEGILVNIFGGIMRCDVIAEGVVAAAREVKLSVPLVVRLEGTNVAAGQGDHGQVRAADHHRRQPRRRRRKGRPRREGRGVDGRFSSTAGRW